ncbi:MAG: alpha/beta fold hydrolase [Pseudomarimonas sp.]
MSRRARARQKSRSRRRILVAAGLALAGFLLMAFARPGWFLQAEYARLRWLAGAQASTEVAADHRWSVVSAGSGNRIVLVHGFTGSKENWLPMFAALTQQHQVIAPDLPGWGESERKSGLDYGFSAQAERLAAWLRQQPTGGGPLTLVGHSMGGGIAALVAARYPELVSKLVLLDAAGVRFDDNDFSRAVARGEHPFEVSDRATLDRQLGLVFEQPPWVPWPADRAFIQRRIADQPFEREVLDRIARRDEALQPGIEAISIAAPTLLLWCRDDRIIDLSAARRYAGRIADTRTVLLEGCNHMPMMERPVETAAAIRGFVGE